MATNPTTLTENAGRITAADASYPYGSAKDDSTGTTGDGTPIKKALLNDSYGLIQAILVASGIVPSGNAETVLASQVLQGIVQQAQGRAFTYDEDGASAADAYILDLRSDQQTLASLFDGQHFFFSPGSPNTGASTVDVSLLLGESAGTTVKNIKTPAGADPAAGAIDGRVELVYDSGNDWLELQPVSVSADNVSYDNGTSGLTAADVQAAIDEVFGQLIGVGQTWQDVSGSRSAGVTYTNTTGRPIEVWATIGSATTSPVDITVDSAIRAQVDTVAGVLTPISFIVPDGVTYDVSTGGNIIYWSELR